MVNKAANDGKFMQGAKEKRIHIFRVSWFKKTLAHAEHLIILYFFFLVLTTI